MSDTKIVRKALAVMQDLALGVDTVTQIRGGVSQELRCISVPAGVSSTSGLSLLDPTVYQLARVIQGKSVTDYIADGNTYVKLDYTNSESPYYNRLQSFTLGNTLLNNKDALYNDATDTYFVWNGSYPKVVSPNTVPSAPDWTDVGDGSFSASITDPDIGARLIMDTLGSFGRTQHSINLDGLSVKDYGAIGDWNTATQSGTDDTAAIQATIDALAGSTLRQAGKRIIYLPRGHYKITSLTIPASLEFGLTFAGDGMYASMIWADPSNANPAIDSKIEFVHFQDLALFGALSQTVGGPRKACFYKGQQHQGTPDIDVTFRRCSLGYATDFVQAYGRGVVIDNTCIAAFIDYLVNIVADPSIIFPGGITNAVQTGMRNYFISPQRCDVVSRLFRVTGTATCKDHINDITIANVNALSMDRVGDFADATITQLRITGLNGLNCFASGLLNGKRLINTYIDVDAAKDYNRDLASTNLITGLVTLTGPFQGLVIRGQYRDVVGQLVTAGAVSSGLNINAQICNIGNNNNPFIAVRGANVISSNINLEVTGSVGSSTFAFFDAATQTDNKFKCNAYGANFARFAVSFNPNLLVGAAVQTPTFRQGGVRIESGLAYVDIAYLYNRAATSASQVSISLPIPPVAEYPSMSAAVSGGVTIKFSSLKTAFKGEIIVSSSSIVFYKPDGSPLTEGDLSATFSITLQAVYPIY